MQINTVFKNLISEGSFLKEVKVEQSKKSSISTDDIYSDALV